MQLVESHLKSPAKKARLDPAATKIGEPNHVVVLASDFKAPPGGVDNISQQRDKKKVKAKQGKAAVKKRRQTATFRQRMYCAGVAGFHIN